MAFNFPLPSPSASPKLVTLANDAAAAAARRPSSSPSTLPPALLKDRGRGRAAEPGEGGSIRRRLLLAASTASLLLPSTLLRTTDPNSGVWPWASSQCARAVEKMDNESQQEEDRVVRIFQETSPSVVFIKDIRLASDPKKRGPFPSSVSTPGGVGGGGEDEDWVSSDDDGNAKVEGTGSGFVWNKAGHIVTNYHVIEKLATDQTGLQRCKILLLDSSGNTFAKEGKLIGIDPAYDLAVLKVNAEGDKLRPALIGTSRDLRVGQSCFAIGNPYGYEHTLTAGVASLMQRS